MYQYNWSPTLFAVTCSKPEDCGEETPLCRKFVKGGSQTCRVSHLNFKKRSLQADYFKTFHSDFQCQNGTPTRAIFSRKFHHKKILVGWAGFSSFWYSKSGETIEKAPSKKGGKQIKTKTNILCSGELTICLHLTGSRRGRWVWNKQRLQASWKWENSVQNHSWSFEVGFARLSIE